MNKFNILIAMLVCLNICGCSDFLEEDPKGRLTTGNFYNSESDARQAINGVYRRLSDSWVTGYNIKQIPNDLLKRASWDEASGLSNFTYGSENTYIAGMWQNHYAVIKDCNSVIDNVTANKEKINNWERYVGQAHGIRAFLYFDLVRWFGDVPLVLTDTKSLDGLEVTRTPQKEVFRQIIEDFEYCISHTMDKGDTSKGYQYGRLTKDACHGFLAKVYLWLGSVAQRDGKEISGNAADNFEKSLEHSSAVIQGGRYKLVDYYPDVFNAKTRDKAPDEVLWCVQGLTGDDTGTWTGMMFGIRGNQNLGGSWDNISSSDYHRMMYEPSDSIRRLWNCPRMTIQDDGTLWGWDYKMYWDTRGDQKLSEATENNNWLQWSIGKFRRYPLADPSSYNYTNFGMDEPLLRYADVLLMYAEAYNEVNHGPGDYRPSSGMDMSGISIQSAYDAVNLVRKRSRIANEGIMHQDVLPRKLITDYATEVDECVPDWKPGAYGYIYDGVRTAWEYNRYGDDYTAFRTEILNERARELVAESTDRWCDLVRRGILVKQMQAWRQYNPFISNTEREITTPGAPENIQSRNMLLPVPLSEIDVNKNLTQNPGY
ncbi:RagB/SusD family nutrient uptake outer membrane protein [Bacteroides congonensis]|uniref:RagB/SusD family nutrient uptake outer membrane protein n=1 Tax=Bacteroides congonensis TaxID=1871006 RepID=UPI000935563E|nr:RagB/SusD family nutrient uptake outer membrane protein [Bacteroides congonensis]